MNSARGSTARRWPSRQVIEDRDVVALIEQQFGADAADITRAADDQNFHRPQGETHRAACQKESPASLGDDRC